MKNCPLQEYEGLFHIILLTLLNYVYLQGTVPHQPQPIAGVNEISYTDIFERFFCGQVVMNDSVQCSHCKR